MTEPEPVRCAEHPDVETTLRCGKCGKPICPKCMVQTPVGARCRDCARLYRLPTFQVSPALYARAAAVGLASGAVIGAAWGFIERLVRFFLLPILLGAGVGWLIGELISRSVNRKRGPWLAVIGGLSATVASGMVYVVGLFMSGFLLFNPLSIVISLLALGVSIYMAVSRLK